MKRSSATLLAFAIFVYLAVHKAALFYWLTYETGDDAANSLCIIRAKHFAQLYGCFSRWGFYHPGPAFFYVQGWGEGLFFDWLHLCPTPRNAQTLTQLGLNVCFLVIALRTFVVWLPAGFRRAGFLAGALTLACFHFADDRRNAFFSTWPAYPPILLMLCLLTAGAAVAAGLGSELPLLALAAGFLIHSHVAQPLFVVPLTLLAYAGLWWRCAAHAAKEEGAGASSWRQRANRRLGACWSAWPRAHLLAAGVLAIFLLPLLIDVCRGTDSNLAAILRHLHSHHGEHKRWLRSVLYFIQFGTYALYQPERADFGHYDRAGMLAYLRAHALILACWVGVAATAAWAVVRQVPALKRENTADVAAPIAGEFSTGDTRRFLAWAGGLLGAAVGLTFYWGTIQDGPMFYYNAFFNYGIYYFAALTALASFFHWLPWRPSSPARPLPVATYLVPACLGLIVYGGWNFPAQVKHPQPKSGVGTYGAQLYDHISEAIAATSDPAANRPTAPKFLPDSAQWPWTTAVALELRRTGHAFLVPPQDKVTFGATNTCGPDSMNTLQNGAQIWRVSGSPTPAGLPPPAFSTALISQVPLFLSVSTPTIDPSAPGGASVIDFRSNGNASEYTLYGWSRSEPWGTWSEGFQALLAFKPKPVDNGDVELQIRASPLLFPDAGLHAQRLQVFFNGESLGSSRQFNTATTEVATFIIPAELWNRCASLKYDCAVLGFIFPDANVPAKLDPTGRNQDQRNLAFGFRSLRFTAVGNTTSLTEDADGKP